MPSIQYTLFYVQIIQYLLRNFPSTEKHAFAARALSEGEDGSELSVQQVLDYLSARIPLCLVVIFKYFKYLTEHTFHLVDECEDQFDTCPEMSKNEYCKKYPSLMKIQCKKSCGFCGEIYVFVRPLIAYQSLIFRMPTCLIALFLPSVATKKT